MITDKSYVVWLCNDAQPYIKLPVFINAKDIQTAENLVSEMIKETGIWENWSIQETNVSPIPIPED